MKTITKKDLIAQLELLEDHAEVRVNLGESTFEAFAVGVDTDKNDNLYLEIFV